MKVTIEISSTYGFDRNWTLVCETKTSTKRFYLGQDVKFCQRVLGMSPRQLIQDIGTNRLDTDLGKMKLARYICQRLELNGRTIKKLEPWALCAQ